MLEILYIYDNVANKIVDLFEIITSDLLEERIDVFNRFTTKSELLLECLNIAYTMTGR